MVCTTTLRLASLLLTFFSPNTASGTPYCCFGFFSLSNGLQNEYIEEHIKRHGRRLDYHERKCVFYRS